MKQFIYLDTDIITSIIAQAEHGVVTQLTHEKEKTDDTKHEKTGNISLEGTGSGSLLKFIEATATVSASGEAISGKEHHRSAKSVVEKILHDATFDIAYEYIQPVKTEYGDTSNCEEGNYLELPRVFDFIDFEYLEGLFQSGGLIDFIKQSSAEKIEEQSAQITDGLNRNQLRNAGKTIRANIRDAIKLSNKQFDDTAKIIKVMRSLIPYDRLLVSGDGYAIPLEEKYFRIDPSNLGFKYGGAMTCVGMVTNIIGEDTEPIDDNSIFATLQFQVNETLRKILPSKEKNLCIIHPIAVYYGH